MKFFLSLVRDVNFNDSMNIPSLLIQAYRLPYVSHDEP